MKRQHLLFSGIAAAALIIGVAAFGVSPGTLAVLAVLALCPLMMIFMMGGMHGGGMDHGSQEDKGHQHASTGPSTGRPGGDVR
jgi:hypothetical protein